MSARGWIGYDWFKLAVAVVLALLLLVLRLNQAGMPGTIAPTVPDTAAPLAVPAASQAGAVAVPAVPQATAATVPAALEAAVPAAPAAPEAAPSARIGAPTLTLPATQLEAGQVSLSGTGTAGSQVEVLVDGALVGTATVGDDGTWTLPAELAGGAHEIVVRALDAAGQVAATADPARLEVAAAPVAVPPIAAPAVVAPTIDFPADGAQIAAAPFTLSGTGAPGSAIEILDGDTVIGTATVGPDGTWSFPVTPGAGSASYGVRPVGATSVAGQPVRVTIGVANSAPAVCTELAVGCDAWVTREQGLRLRLRDTASLSGAVLALLPPGTRMALLEGPQPADGHGWWRVRTTDGREGWVAGRDLRLQPD
jgi:hypothetical protein